MHRLTGAVLLVAAGCTEVSITPIDNKPPTVEILTHRDGDVVREGYTINLGGSVSDDRGLDQVTVTWFVDEVEVCAADPAEDGGTNCSWTVPEDTDARIRLEALDEDGDRGSEIVDVVIEPNTPPEVVISSPEATRRYYNNAPVRLAGVASDDEDDPTELVAGWVSDADGGLPGGDAVPDIRGVFEGDNLLSEGTHTLTVTVTDQGGKSGEAEVTIDVGGPNTPPTCELISPLNGSESGQFNEVLFVGLVDDVDIPADELTVVFESDTDGLMGGSTPSINGDVQYPFDQLSMGPHVITMTVTDDAGVPCTDSITHTVVEPPTAPAVHIEPGTPGSSDDLLCVIDVPSTDPQGDPLTYEFSWTVDGVESTNTYTTLEQGDTVPFVFTGPGQVWLCEGRATDGQTWSSPGTDSVTIETPTVVTVHAGQDHTCQLDTNQTLECWGDNSFNKQDLEGGLYQAVALGNNHTCGIDLYSTIQCSGLDTDLQTSGAPQVGAWSAIDAGDAHTCALSAGGSITCWGNDDEGQSDASVLTGTYTSLSSNFRHNCAVRTDNQVDCWGSDVFGRSTPTPTVVWSQISAGKYHTCGLDLTGEAWCFGKDNQGQSQAPGGTFDEVSAGTEVTCGLRGTGAIECWGELTGPGEINDPPVGLFTDIDGGNGHFCAVTMAGAVECWGDNSAGELDAPLTWW
jgi:alpha-tubulin suppressor-like RCC1 family protein